MHGFHRLGCLLNTFYFNSYLQLILLIILEVKIPLKVLSQTKMFHPKQIRYQKGDNLNNQRQKLTLISIYQQFVYKRHAKEALLIRKSFLLPCKISIVGQFSSNVEGNFFFKHKLMRVILP